MLTTLRRIVQAVNSAPNLMQAVEVMVSLVKEAFATEVCSVYLFDHTENRYFLMATEGLNKEAVGQVSLGISEGLVGLVGLREEPVNIEIASAHPKYRYLAETGEEKFGSFLGAPIIHHGRVLGVVVVQEGGKRCFDQSEEAFLVTICAQLAGVIAHAESTGALVGIPYLFGKDRTVEFRGVSGASGVAIGPAVVIYPLADLDAVPDRKVDEIEPEVEAFEYALAAVQAAINKLRASYEHTLQREEKDLFDVYLRILDKNSIGGEIIDKIEEGYWAQSALRIVVEQYVKNFEAMDDPYLRERAADVRDLGLRILAQLQQNKPPQLDYPERSILIGEEITTSVLMEIPRDKLAGIVSVKGSINSHMAIVARALGVPTVVGAVDLPFHQLENCTLIVDGYQGLVSVNPSPESLKHYEVLRVEEEQLVEDMEGYRDLPAETPDGHKVALWVNTGLMADVLRSLDRGAEGVGLYRTEIPFMTRDRFPSEQEQIDIYQEQLKAFTPHPVTMRTLDIGGDKALPYFPIAEENPFLGWRGIRISLDHPEIFLVQVRSMLKAGAGLSNLRILLPMITNVLEVEEACYFIHRAYLEVKEEGFDIEMPPVGAMIEIPGAVYQVREIAQRVDFISVGSNDLTQYLLAVDRNNPRVADLYQSCHPAVLQALQLIVDEAHKEGKPVSICGEMAGDARTAVLLMAMGYDSLSMSAANLLRVKWALRQINMESAKTWLNEIKQFDNAEVISSYMDMAFEREGLGGLIRAGK